MRRLPHGLPGHPEAKPGTGHDDQATPLFKILWHLSHPPHNGQASLSRQPDSEAILGTSSPSQHTATDATRAPRRRKGQTRARRVLDRAPPLQGWLSNDEDEIERRRWRGQTEITGVEALEPAHPYFGAFRVRSASGGSYEVELRSLTKRLNPCGCADHRVNGLGTCKHIEGVLAALRRRGKRAFAAAARQGNPGSNCSCRATATRRRACCGRQRRQNPRKPRWHRSSPWMAR
jgi:hypothetical protein